MFTLVHTNTYSHTTQSLTDSHTYSTHSQTVSHTQVTQLYITTGFRIHTVQKSTSTFFWVDYLRRGFRIFFFTQN